MAISSFFHDVIVKGWCK